MRLLFSFLSAALLASLATPAQAFIFDRDNNYECSCEPLYCGAWGVQLQGGVRPIIWTNRGNLSLVNCTLAPDSILTAVGGIPKFSRLFHVPWQIGGQLSYALSTNSMVFTEVNYAQARGKTSAVFPNTSFGLFGLSKYRLIDWYVGARYYTDRGYCLCDTISFFLGGKIGLIHHKTSGVNALVSAAATDCCNAVDLFGRNTVFAGGAHVGVDYCYCGNWSFVLTAEVVASCAPSSIGHARLTQVAINNLNLATNVIVGNIGTEIAFPITVGVKYNF